ncbi:chemotaxis protein CheY [Cryobacterium melibiosiphilum]|uniref:Chemotaxis protein CheY n=1 Tax=Cryobacterium melibiosiphilum TaxID=995039 RepID=A0A3A5MEB2_9MICO|nr:chemotaxis protein CheY [Cryobacterium melibiosiphilum]RJT88470.1 chemotaxis protein CheY [Cryobacterium melibiosiphilum]
METQSPVSPAEARSLLDHADRISRQAHESTRWPYITFILALGVSTSLGTLAMGLTTGDAFGMSYFGTLTVGLALIIFFSISIQGRAAFARSRRWTAYIAIWVATYAAAIVVAAWVHGSVLWSGITSGLILVVTMSCAAYEARR